MEYASFFLPHVKTFTICLNNLCKEIKRFIIVIYVIAAAGPGKCLINHGGCWHETRNGKTFSACQVGLGFYYMIYGFITEYLSVASQLFFLSRNLEMGNACAQLVSEGTALKNVKVLYLVI